jgi:hypothetical protein
MEAAFDDCFVVYSHNGQGPADRPEGVEQVLAVCPTYEEACRVRQQYHGPASECIIRFVGPAGGGD